MTEFKPFPKVYRYWEQEVVITEKIDGTNASIYIGPDGEFLTASRKRWITPEDDNYGFSQWAHKNKEELMKLGEGFHFGEWWGKGVQHGYGMSRKVFSLFNANKWTDESVRPSCCDVVPIVAQGRLLDIGNCFQDNTAVPSLSPAAFKYGIECNKVEGLMYYFTSSGIYMKSLVELNHKGAKE